MAKNRMKPTGPHKQAAGDLGWDSLFSSLGRIEIVLLVGGVLLLMVLIYTIQSILSPFLVLGAIIFILYPMRRYAVARNIMWLSVTLFALWFLHTVSNILAPFVVSLVFAYILDPVVDLFEGWKVPRWLSALVLILLFLTGITLMIFFVLPIAVSQFEGVLESVSRVIVDFRNAMGNSKIVSMFERYGIKPEEFRNTLVNQLTPRVEDILKNLLSGFLVLVSSISNVLAQIMYVIMVPFLTFYILTDFPKINHRFKMLFPKRVRDQVGDIMSRADDLIGHYLRRSVTVAIIQGVAVAVSFSLFGINYALLLGLLAAVFDLIPYFGLIILMALSSIVASFSDPPVLPKVAFVLGTIGILHIVEIVFLSPKIVGGKVGVHPLLMILSLLVFMYFLGFVGLLIAVPSTALIILFVREWEAKRRGTRTLESSQPVE